MIQSFEDPRGGASHGNAPTRWGAMVERLSRDHFRVHVPAHVCRVGKQIKPDRALLEALLRCRSRDEWSGIYRGIVLFNQANTDAPDMSMDTELVLTYAAMEQILGISSASDRRRFHAKFAEAWDPSRAVPVNEWRAPTTGRTWTKDNLRACWAYDLQASRGNLAHGQGECARPSLWTVRQHLLLTSFAVPRLVKRVLSGLGLYEATDDDEGDINALELLLNLPDVFATPNREDDEGGSVNEGHAWRRVVHREKVRHRVGQWIEKHWDRDHQVNGIDP